MSAVKDENPMVSTFEADDQRFICLNGGPEYRPNPSISFYVIYESEKDDEEIRY
jgi:predicted 3-demethylubiquinone-9 3-methyltransferase (glyoxalase superfamily)